MDAALIFSRLRQIYGGCVAVTRNRHLHHPLRGRSAAEIPVNKRNIQVIYVNTTSLDLIKFVMTKIALPHPG